MDKRKIRTILLVILTITIFSLSYYVCINRLKSTNIKKSRYQVNGGKQGSSDYLTVHSNVDDVVSANANVIFKLKYVKSGEIITEKAEKADGLVGKKKVRLTKCIKMKVIKYRI